MTTKKTRVVEMPDGTKRSYNVESLDDLKEQVSVSIGVERDEVTIITDEGTPVSNAMIPVQDDTLRVIPKPKWG